jgi:hypothetical protein
MNTYVYTLEWAVTSRGYTQRYSVDSRSLATLQVLATTLHRAGTFPTFHDISIRADDGTPIETER